MTVGGWFEEDLQSAVDILRKGGTILYPTDTVWGIGCDARNSVAVQKIFDIKRRNESKALIILVANYEQLGQYVREVPKRTFELLHNATSAISIVYDNPINVSEKIISPENTICIRVVKDAFCQSLINCFGAAIVSTSANLSGNPTPSNFKNIDAVILNNVDYVVKWRQSDDTCYPPSTIIQLTINGEIKVLR